MTCFKAAIHRGLPLENPRFPVRGGRSMDKTQHQHKQLRRVRNNR